MCEISGIISNYHKSQGKIIKLWDYLRIFVPRNKLLQLRMKKRTLFYILFAMSFCSRMTATSAEMMTYDERESFGGFPILGGELSNSAATSVDDIDEVMPRMRALGLNTVLVPAYWELMEPVEGKFNFTLIDRTIDVVRREHLHVVFLWFGAWKNSMA